MHTHLVDEAYGVGEMVDLGRDCRWMLDGWVRVAGWGLRVSRGEECRMRAREKKVGRIEG